MKNLFSLLHDQTSAVVMLCSKSPEFHNTNNQKLKLGSIQFIKYWYETWVLINSCDLIISNGFFKYVQFKLWINFQSWNWIKFWRSTKVWEIQKEWKPILGIFVFVGPPPSSLIILYFPQFDHIKILSKISKTRIKMIKVPPLVKLNFNPFALSFMRPFHYHALYFQKRAQPSILINCEEAGAALVWCVEWPEEAQASLRVPWSVLSFSVTNNLRCSEHQTRGPGDNNKE